MSKFTKGPWTEKGWAMSHTPGEWIAQPDPNALTRDDWVIGIEGGKIDEVAVCSERDARLIAAAPDLLDALKLCAAVCAGEVMDKNGLVNALEKARAAIAKATGEAP